MLVVSSERMKQLAPTNTDCQVVPWSGNGSWDSDAVRQQSLAIFKLVSESVGLFAALRETLLRCSERADPL